MHTCMRALLDPKGVDNQRVLCNFVVMTSSKTGSQSITEQHGNAWCCQKWWLPVLVHFQVNLKGYLFLSVSSRAACGSVRHDALQNGSPPMGKEKEKDGGQDFWRSGMLPGVWDCCPKLRQSIYCFWSLGAVFFLQLDKSVVEICFIIVNWSKIKMSLAPWKKREKKSNIC